DLPCASAASGMANEAPRINAPRRRAVSLSMFPSSWSLFVCVLVAHADVFVLVIRALRQRGLVGGLVALEEIARVRLGVLLAGVGLGSILRDLVAGGGRQGRREERDLLH